MLYLVLAHILMCILILSELYDYKFTKASLKQISAIIYFIYPHVLYDVNSTCW